MDRYTILWIATYLLVLSVAVQITYIRFIPPANIKALSSSSFSASTNPKITPQKRSLPDNWQWHQQAINQAQYEVQFDAQAAEDETWALMIPTVRYNLQATLNGKIIGNGGSMVDPISHNLRRPLLLIFSSSLLMKNNNQLLLDVISPTAGKGFLDQVYIGRHDELKKAWSRHYFFRIQVVESITVALVIMAAVFYLLQILRPSNTEYGWFALSATLWAMHNCTNHITNLPVSNHLWDWFTYVTLGWFSLATPIVLLRFEQQKQATLEKTLLFLAVVLPAAMLALPQTNMHWFADHIWYPLIFSVGGLSLLYIAVRAWRTRNLEYQLLALSGLFIVPYSLHDLLLVRAVWPWNEGYYIQFGAIILMLVFTGILLSRLVSATRLAELLNEDLEQQVQQRTDQYKQAMHANQLLEKKQLLSEERTRITRDMHDGVAGQLLSTMVSLDQGKLDMSAIRRQLDFCITDIRLIIDSADEESNDLVALLGMFRYRLNKTLESTEIELDWQALPMDQSIELAPTRGLNLLRILQEIVHNAIRHADCSLISIKCELLQQQDGATAVDINVSDNGVGLSTEWLQRWQHKLTEEDFTNRGLRNLRYRARQIDAKIHLDSTHSGTQYTIRFSSS